MSAERVVVVLVNYNSAEHLPHCLAALATQTLAHDTLVVDNASWDGSARAARAAHPEAAFLPLRHNVGFARAVNLAAERLAGCADVLVLLNPDTIPRPDFLEQMLAPMRVNPRVGAVAGTLVFATQPDRIASAGIVVHRNGVALDARLGDPAPERGAAALPVFGASGGAAAYRLEAFRAAGGFPEAFSMYLEDVDLAWRLRRRGWQAVWAPAAIATHAYSASAGEGSPLKRRLLARNRLWTLARALPREAWLRDWRSIIMFDLLAWPASMARGDWAGARGRLEALLGLPARLQERTKIDQEACNEQVEGGAWAELEPWIMPAIGLRRLLELRRLTARLAASPTSTAQR